MESGHSVETWLTVAKAWKGVTRFEEWSEKLKVLNERSEQTLRTFNHNMIPF